MMIMMINFNQKKVVTMLGNGVGGDIEIVLWIFFSL